MIAGHVEVKALRYLPGRGTEILINFEDANVIEARPRYSCSRVNWAISDTPANRAAQVALFRERVKQW